jgi:hypothetical protein
MDRTRLLTSSSLFLVILLTGCVSDEHLLTQPSSPLPSHSTLTAICSNLPFTTPVEGEKDISADTDHWEIFTDTDVGFRIKYPPGWRVQEIGKGVGFGPVEMREDVQWGVEIYDLAQTSVEEIVAAVGAQFNPDRNEERECMELNGMVALQVVVQTSKFEDWYSVSSLLEHDGKIVRLSNGAVADKRFELFYQSIEFLP